MTIHVAGRIRPEPGLDISYSQHGRDLAAVITALDLHEVNLVGWSYGSDCCLRLHRAVRPHASAVVHTSHLAFWDNPDEFNRRLVEFLHTGS